MIRSQIIRLFYVSMHGRCFICLDNVHIAKNCTSQYVCKRCKKGKHHISICEAYPLGKRNDSNNDKEGGNNTTDKDNSSFTGHTGCENKGILLQTALANICPADTTEVINTTLGYYLTVAANAHTYQQRLGKHYS